VPKAVVCYNLKAGVTKASRYEPGVNRTYQDLATHYGFAILPTRAQAARQGEGGSGSANYPALRAGAAAEPALLLA
jgi:transposase